VAEPKEPAKKPVARKPATGPAAEKPAAPKPAAAKAPVAKPAAAKPATAKPTVSKTTAAKPPVAKAAAAKPAATKPATATPTARKPPVKKPVVETVQPGPAPVPEEAEATPSFSESLSAAVRQSGFAQLKPGETPSGRALLGAIGGIRGIIESIVPGIAYLAIYLPTRNLLIAVLVPAFIALVFVVARAGARSSMSSAVTGAVLLAITAVLTLITGRAVNNFVPGILINAVFFVVMLASILARWPIIGLVVGLLFGDVTGWRADPVKRRILTIATWFWVALFAVRLIVEVPLYFADNVAALGVVRLVTSVPLYAVCLWATWLLVRGVYAGVSTTENSDTDTDAE
jgi:hypothetical protein